MADENPSDDYALIADVYDHIGPYRDRPDVEFFVRAARTAGGPVLELGCGTGRVLIPTARAGIEITGLDLSRHMLDVCREQAAREPHGVRSRIRLIEGDMRSFDLDRTFSLVTIPFRPFQHLLTVEDQLSCLASVRRHLDDGGQLIIDIFNPSLDFLVNRPVGEVFGEEPEFTTPDGRRIVRSHRLLSHDRFTQISRFELIYDVVHPDGHRERLTHEFPLRYLFRFELEHLLARAGFRAEHIYSDYNKSEFGSRYSGELLVVARRESAKK
jgi:SAM-dependent methyltransferase